MKKNKNLNRDYVGIIIDSKTPLWKKGQVIFELKKVSKNTYDMLLYMRILFLGIGFSWASININSYPFLSDMSPLGLLGTYTGVYYLFSSIANIVSPPLLGALIDGLGYHIVFLYGAFWFGMAFIFINLVMYKDKCDN